MKKSIKIWLIAAMAAVSGSALATNVTLPAGVYYLDLRGVTAKKIDFFNDIKNGNRYGTSTPMTESDLSFDTSLPVNAGITKDSYKTYSKSTFKYIAVELKYKMTIDNGNKIFQYQDNSDNWHGWQEYSSTNLTNLGTAENPAYLGIVDSDGHIAWQTSGTIPSGTPVLTFTAGSNGEISTHTKGAGTNVNSGDEVAAGTTVNLVATPYTGYSFYGWVRSDGSVASTLANYVFSMPSSSLDLTATFYSDSTDPVISGCSGCFRVAP